MAWLENREGSNRASSFLEIIFKNITDAILVLDQKGFVIDSNPAAVKLTGWSAEELKGSVHFCAICKGVASCTEEATCSECFKHSFSVPSFEMRVKSKDGRELQVAASSTHLPETEIGHMVVVLRDMSEQQRVERERVQRMMTNYVIQAQEEERKRVSRDLHDGVGQALYSILVGLRMIDHLQVDPSIKSHLVEVREMTARALEEVKNMAVELRPSALDDLGLVPAIRSYLKRFEQTFGIESELAVTGSRRRYAPTVETALYRICQEAMTNAAKYADTDKIFVRLADKEDRIELDVQDYGRGFDPSHIRILGTGIGLYGMRERANLLGGHVDIQSAIGQGTTIRVLIPLNQKGEPLYVDPGTDCR